MVIIVVDQSSMVDYWFMVEMVSSSWMMVDDNATDHGNEQVLAWNG